MRYQTDAKGNNHCSHATGEKEWNDWNKSADRSGDCSRNRRSPLIWKAMLRQAQLALRHRLHELVRLLSETLSHFLRLFRGESLQLIEERHLFDFFLRIFFDFCALARNLGFINFRLALCGKVRTSAHRQRGSEHSRKTGDQDVMLLVVGCASHAVNNSKHRAETVVCTIDRVGHPTAPSPVPAFA